MIIASSLGPAQPLATAWNGAGAWLIFSQSRQLNLLALPVLLRESDRHLRKRAKQTKL